MLIVCPTCATSYTIEPASLGPEGRTVRCTRCKASWFAGAPAEPVADFVADVIAEAEARESPAAPGPPPTADDFGPEPTLPASHLNGIPDAADHVQIQEPVQEPIQESIQEPVLPTQEAPPIVPPLTEQPVADAAQDDAASFSARRARMHVRRKQRQRTSKWAVVILLLLGVHAALYVGRYQVVRFFPQTDSLYRRLGLDVNLRHLAFKDVKITREERDGVPVLAIEGTILSQSNNPVEVPRLRFAVRNATGQEIYAWTAKPARGILEPGDALPFHSRLASPPADASDVLVRFANANDAAEK
jgi:predicted Zn finger-like uncharacterized protein